MKFIIDGKTFIDELNRERIWNGINIVFKGEDQEDGKRNYIYKYSEEDFENLQRCGINLIRLGIVWDAIEPEYNNFNNDYLDNVEYVLDMCTKYEIELFLDMHQDLYGCLFDGGAPAWATISDNKPHIKGEVWSDAYLYSEAVNTSFVNFWNNKKTEHGIGLIDHYKNLWSHVIARFKDHPALIGYDFINEPFSGENSQCILKTLLNAYFELTGAEVGDDEGLEIFVNDEKKLELLKVLDNKELYAQVVSKANDLVQIFDKTKLANFYIEITRMLRENTNNGFVLTENSYFSNMGIEAGTQKIIIDGNIEKKQVYSPHGYDLVVDSPLVSMSSNNRVDVILDAHRRVQNRLNVPVIFGEWGAHYKNSERLDHIQHILGYFDQNKWSHTYYCWIKEMVEYPIVNVLSRPYPKAVNGRIQNYCFNFETKQFKMNWLGHDNSQETIVFLPTRPRNFVCNGECKLERCNGYYHLIIKNTHNENNLIINL